MKWTKEYPKEKSEFYWWKEIKESVGQPVYYGDNGLFLKNIRNRNWEKLNGWFSSIPIEEPKEQP